MSIFKSISLHPKLAAVLEALAGLALFMAVLRSFVWWQVVLALALKCLWSAVLVRRVYNPLGAGRLTHWLTIGFFDVGMLLITLFSEWRTAFYLLAGVITIGPALSFWFLPGGKTELPFALKPYRRINFMLTIMGLAGVWSALWAAVIFRIYNVSFWVVSLLGIGITLLTSYWWWHEYKIDNKALRRWWLLVFFILFLELSWVFFHSPLAYFIRGLAMVWIWCILWLTARFSMSTEGIEWKKFSSILLSNIIGFLILLGLFAHWK